MTRTRGPRLPGPHPSPDSGLEIQSLLFDGAPTRVYRARTAEGRQVVLKSLHNDADPIAAAAGIQHEYDIARVLDTEHVVRVYGVELGGERLSLVLEDFGGQSLDQVMNERPLTVEQILEIGVQVADGLAAIHAAGIIHKDITPSNIVYNCITGTAKIIDFGISSYLTREQADMGNPATLEGSLPYVSPEQTGRMNRALDYRTDFYSLGATLYELLARRPLFDVQEPIEWLHCHIARQPPPLHTVAALPGMVSAIVERLLAKSADERYCSAGGLRADLQRCLTSLREQGDVPTFELGTRDLPDRFQIRQHLYGRDAQLEQLMASFDRASSGSAELVLVCGYSGIGKTCLVKELYRPITARRGFFVSGKFDQLHRNVPLSAVITALRDLVRQLLTEPEDRLAVWRQRLIGAMEGHGRLMVDLIGDLGLIVGQQPSLEPLSAQAAENRFRRTLVNFIRAFAQPEHPLVMFLDDLQWADAATFDLLELVLTEASLEHLLIIGAYRDNEVHPAHPLMQSVGRIRRCMAVDELALPPLSREELARLLADTLHVDPAQVDELADLVERKTGGNPYFTEEFLKDLYRRDLISYDGAGARWTWSIERIATERMTDNVVDLMAEKLRRLSAPAREMLQIAACIGHRLELGMLLAVCGRRWQELAPALREAMSHGLIAPLGPHCQLLSRDQEPGVAERGVELAFAHDRIQQAAHGLLDAATRQRTHLRIGRILISHAGHDGVEENLFRITDHLNTARALITTNDERRELCGWNRAAGERARNAAAFHAAAEYFATAIRLLDEDCWSGRHEETLTLYADAAECGCLSSRHDSCEALISEALSRVSDVDNAALLHQIRMKSLIAQGLHTHALEVGRTVLRQLGHRIPRRFVGVHLAVAYLRVRRRLRGMSMRDLRALPAAGQQASAHSYRVGEQMAVAAQFAEPLLLLLMATRGVQSALAVGVSERAIIPFGGFGIQIGTQRGNIAEGEKYSRFAQELCERFQAPAARARVHLHHYAYLAPWKEPLKTLKDPLMHAYELCLEAADFDGAAQALSYLGSYSILSGAPLAAVREDLQTCRTALTALNQREAVLYLDMQIQMVANLLGEAEDAALLKGARYDIQSMLAEHERLQARRLVLSARARQAILLMLLGRPQAALAHFDVIRQFLPPIERVFDGCYVHFQDSLARLAVARGSTGGTRRRLLRQARRSRRVLDLWARRVPANAAARSLLVEAEWHHTRGDEGRAQRSYDQAIAAAREHHLPQDEGQANYLCALMHLIAGRQTIADAYLRKARDAYHRWGAHALVRHLEEQYPALAPQSVSTPRTRTPGAITGETLLAGVDVTALMKALKSIAEERVHSRMVRTIIGVAMEFAGAQHGLLMLRSVDHKLRIEAEASVDGAEPQILQSIDVQDSLCVSQAVVNYVTRTCQGVVVNDAQQPDGPIPGLHLDRHVREQRVSSVLCLPLVAAGDRESALIGLLYLENNRASHTFSEQRFDTLEIICVAAAGRLELARKAAVDGLTGLFNRDYFQTMLHQELLASQRHGRSISLIMADIDHFKRFNDTWGHQVGDEVLKAVAGALNDACRESDVVARYGGEELAVILPDTDAAGAHALAERLRLAVECLELAHAGQSVTVTLSLGVATAGDTVTNEEDLLRRADAALYAAKHAGRNLVRAA